MDEPSILPVTDIDIIAAFGMLSVARGHYSRAVARVEAAEVALKDREAAALINGEIEGKNAETRAASSRELTHELRHYAIERREARDLASLELERAKDKVKMIELRLRLMSLNNCPELILEAEIE